jgi:hypothetical protein
MNLANTFIQTAEQEASERTERERERQARQRAAQSRARNEVAEAALAALGLTDAKAVDCGPNWYHTTGYVVEDIRIRGHLVSNYAAPSDLTTAHEISVDPYCEDCAQFVTAWGSVTTRYLEPRTARQTPTVEQLRVKIGQSIRQTRANHAPRCPGVLDIYNDPLIG